ncbi:MAG: hypothetical protein WAN51_07920, partial [Alphaproteobacteria bacterium]
MDSQNTNLDVAQHTAADTGSDPSNAQAQADTGANPNTDSNQAAQFASDVVAVQAYTDNVIGQAGGTVQHVASPPAGEQTTIAVVAGTQYDFDFHKGDADFVFSDGNLIILIHGGGEIILQGFGSEAAGNAIPPLNFAGDIIGAFDLLGQTASAEQLAEIQPAAGPGAGANLPGPASFEPFAPLALPPGIPELGPIPPTALSYVAPEMLPIIFTLPPSVVPVVAPQCFQPFTAELTAFFADVQHIPPGPPADPSNYNSIFAEGPCAFVSGGEGNDFITAYGFGDTVVGHGGNDWIVGTACRQVLVGDVYGNYEDPYREVFAGSGSAAANYNDTIFGFGSHDTIVGDVYAPHGSYVELFAGVGYGGGSVNAFNDYLSSSGGSSKVVGDVYQTGCYGYNSVELAAYVESNAAGHVYAFNDTIFGGDGTGGTEFFYGGCPWTVKEFLGGDTLVGDVYQQENGAAASLIAFGEGGPGTVVQAFDNYLDGGKVLVGNVLQEPSCGFTWNAFHADLYAIAGAGYGGAGGNFVFAFDDVLLGGDRTLIVDVNNIDQLTFLDSICGDSGRLLVGDVAQLGGGSYCEGNTVSAYGGAGTSFFGYYSEGQANNDSVAAFDDSINGGTTTIDINASIYGGVCLSQIESILGNCYTPNVFTDTLVGDVFQENNCFASGDVNLHSFAFGNNDIVSTFSDTIIGSTDLIDVNLTVDGGYGGTLTGGVGNADIESPTYGNAAGFFADKLIGDVYQTGGSGNTTELSANVIGSNDSVYSYEDQINGGNHIITVNVTETNGGGFYGDPGSFTEGFAGDTLVGDVWQQGGHSVDLGATVGGEWDTTSSNDTICVFGDSIVAGTSELIINNLGYGGGSDTITGLGHELLVGDVYAQQSGHCNNVDLNVAVSALGYGGVSDNNLIHAFNNYSMVGSLGDDTIVGNVLADQTSCGDGTNSVRLNGGIFAAYGGQADGNNFFAFDDSINGNGGSDSIVGNVSASMHAANFGEGCVKNSVSLGVDNRAWDSGQADGNTISAFNDVITNSSNGNFVAGDVAANMCAFDGGGYENRAENSINMAAINSAFDSGTANGNTINAYNDTIVVTGAYGGDNYVAGDVGASMHAAAADGCYNSAENSIALAAKNIAFDSGTANGNTINAYNNSIIIANAYGGG